MRLVTISEKVFCNDVLQQQIFPTSILETFLFMLTSSTGTITLGDNQIPKPHK